MHNLIFRNLLQLRQNYWFWPSLLTVFALLLLPSVIDAISTQISELAHAASDTLSSTIARDQVATACNLARRKIANHREISAGEGSS